MKYVSHKECFNIFYNGVDEAAGSTLLPVKSSVVIPRSSWWIGNSTMRNYLGVWKGWDCMIDYFCLIKRHPKNNSCTWSLMCMTSLSFQPLWKFLCAGCFDHMNLQGDQTCISGVPTHLGEGNNKRRSVLLGRGVIEGNFMGSSSCVVVRAESWEPGLTSLSSALLSSSSHHYPCISPFRGVPPSPNPKRFRIVEDGILAYVLGWSVDTTSLLAPTVCGWGPLHHLFCSRGREVDVDLTFFSFSLLTWALS